MRHHQHEPKRKSIRNNAFCESSTKTLKSEEVHRREYRDLAGTRALIEQFIETIYKGKRLDSALEYRWPKEFELSLTVVPASTVQQVRA